MLEQGELMTTEQRIADLESRLDNVLDAQAIIIRQLGRAHVDQWQARIDDLGLQAHLGTAEASDRIAALTADLNSRWSKVRRQLTTAGETSAEVSDTMRAGLENAYKDLREALVESRKQLR